MSNDQTDDRPHEQPIEEVPRLVSKNGLAQLFANRVRARILVALFYAESPLTADEIADATDTTQTVVYEALDQLKAFEIFDRTEQDEPGNETYRLIEDDRLVEAVRTVAETATTRLYD